MIDVQINDFVLSLFPEDFVARRRAEGMSIMSDPLLASEAELRALRLRLPHSGRVRADVRDRFSEQTASLPLIQQTANAAGSKS